MRLITLLSIAAASLSLLFAASRPRYGGILRVQLRAVVHSLDPSERLSDPLEAAAKEQIVSQVFETLVRLNDKGEPQPHLAISWKLDAAKKSWAFTPRPKVTWQNGVPWQPNGGVILVPADRPIEDILRDLARPKNAIVARSNEGNLLGTGPFRIHQFEPGKSVVLTAYDGHWAGRSFLDTVEIQLGRSFREQSLDFDLGKVDVSEIPLADLRRAQQRNGKVAVSAPLENLALIFDRDRPVPDPIREAIALTLDRAAIRNVLLQKTGEANASLLPRWLSGYSFVFRTERDLARAKQLAAGAQPVSFAYDKQDALSRAIAERVSLNASEGGITLKPATGPAQLKLTALRVTMPDAYLALDEIATSLGVPPQRGFGAYERERAMLDAHRVIPVVQLSALHRLGMRVQGWLNAPWVAIDRWQLANVWLGDERP